MKIGIKYCGGCNSRYDRKQEVQKLIREFPQHTFVYATQDTNVCAVWLIVCGCITCCASTDGLVATKKLFVLHTPRNFADVVSFINQEAAVPEIEKKSIPQIGDGATVVKTITTADVAEFEKLSNNFENSSVTAVFPTHSGFEKLAVQGLLTGSLMVALLGTQRSGNRPILLNEQLHFRRPVVVGDTLTLSVTLKKIKEMNQCYVWKLYVYCKNQRGDVVVKGLCHQIIVK